MVTFSCFLFVTKKDSQSTTKHEGPTFAVKKKVDYFDRLAEAQSAARAMIEQYASRHADSRLKAVVMTSEANEPVFINERQTPPAPPVEVSDGKSPQNT